MEINIKILKGLQNIEDTSMLSVIFFLVVEGLVRDGFVQALDNNKYTKEQRDTILSITQELLTLDTSAFFVAMQKEKEFLSNLDFNRELKEKYIAQEVGKNYKFLMEDMQGYIEIYQNNFYNKMFDAMKKETAEAAQVYEDEMKKMIKEHSSTINYIHFTTSALWIKIRSLLGIEIKDFGYVSRYLAHNLVYVATPKINEIYTDYLKHIQKNKMFLKQLK